MSNLAQFQAGTRGIFAEKNFAKTLYDEQIALFMEQTEKQEPYPESFAISNLLFDAFQLALGYSLPQIEEMEFPQPELPVMQDVNDTAFTNVVPVRSIKSPTTAQNNTQQIQIPVQLEQIGTQEVCTRKPTLNGQMQASRFERPPSAAEARKLSKQIDMSRAQQKQEKLDVTVLSATRRNDILKQLNETTKQGKKITDLPVNQQIVIDAAGKVVGIAADAARDAQRIGTADLKQIKKEAPQKKGAKADSAIVQQKKDQNLVFEELGKKYEQTLLKTAAVPMQKK